MPRQVSALLLAAGASRRMGAVKALLQLGGRPAIRICTETLLAAGVQKIIVVTGPESRAIEQALAGLPLEYAINNARESAMADSVRVGLDAVPPESSAVLVCLCDHTLVKQATIRMLLQTHEADPEKIIIPAFQGRNGHPTLFPATVIKEILEVETLRDVVRKDGSRVFAMAVEDEGVVLDMDTPEDYERARSRISDVPKS